MYYSRNSNLPFEFMNGKSQLYVSYIRNLRDFMDGLLVIRFLSAANDGADNKNRIGGSSVVNSLI